MRGLVSLPYPQEVYIDPEHLMNGAVFQRSNMRRDEATANLAALTTQVMLSVAIPLQYRDVVAKLAFRSGTTAAGTPTNYWFALYDTEGALLLQTADQASGAWAADTTKTLSLSKSYEAPAAGVYYAAIMVKATTVPTLLGKSVQHADVSTGIVTGQKILSRTSGAALAATAPATIATATAVTTVPWCIALAA